MRKKLLIFETFQFSNDLISDKDNNPKNIDEISLIFIISINFNLLIPFNDLHPEI